MHKSDIHQFCGCSSEEVFTADTGSVLPVHNEWSVECMDYSIAVPT